MKNPVVQYIFHNHFLATVLFLLFGWFLLQIHTILVGLFISYIIMAGLSPFVLFLEKKKFPRFLAVIIPYSIMIFLLVVLIIPVIPFFVSQIQALFSSLPSYLERSGKILGFSLNAEQLQDLSKENIGSIGQNALFITSKLFGGIFSILSIFVVAFYLLLDRDNVKGTLMSLLPSEIKNGVDETITQIEEKLGAWLRGQIVLSVVIGVITWMILSFLGIDFALSLAVIAGILEIVPTIGPIIAAVPAAIVAFTISPPLAIAVIASYFVIQMLENNILVPRIMSRAVGLNPIIVIVGVLIGSAVLGVAGALLSIPFIAMLVVVFQNIKKISYK